MPYVVKSRATKGSALNVNEADIAVGLPQVTQSSHGFSDGDVVRNSAADTWTEAQADTEANVGIGISLVFDSDTNTFTAIGKNANYDVTLTAHGFGSFGQKLYLSAATPGLIATSPPTSGVEVYLGYVVDTDTIRWEPGLLF